MAYTVKILVLRSVTKLLFHEQKNLGLNPAALLPGALPPNRDTDPGGVDFDDPADVSTLQSASKVTTLSLRKCV